MKAPSLLQAIEVFEANLAEQRAAQKTLRDMPHANRDEQAALIWAKIALDILIKHDAQHLEKLKAELEAMEGASCSNPT